MITEYMITQLQIWKSHLIRVQRFFINNHVTIKYTMCFIYHIS